MDEAQKLALAALRAKRARAQGPDPEEDTDSADGAASPGPCQSSVRLHCQLQLCTSSIPAVLIGCAPFQGLSSGISKYQCQANSGMRGKEKGSDLLLSSKATSDEITRMGMSAAPVE